VPIPNFNPNSFVQAHSHVTFLGWGFLAAVSFVTVIFFPKHFSKKGYLYPFWIMVTSLVGMLISFPLQGYKLYSIVFLSVFLFTSYVYLWKLYAELKGNRKYSAKFIRTGILYYYLSSMAIWAIAIISVKIGKNDLYHYAIYFYLHFLYNGFFVFTLFGLLVKYLEKVSSRFPKKEIGLFYLLTNIACIPAYTLSLVWNNMPVYIVALGFLAAILQLFSLFYLWKFIKIFWNSIKATDKILPLVAILVLIAYFTKIVLQLVSAFPELASIAVLYKPYFVIGYIHLFTLGFMSLFLFLIYVVYTQRNLYNWGMSLFILGVIGSETLLFLQGGLLYLQEKSISNLDMILLILSFLMPLGLLLIYIRQMSFLKKD
jgi:hypothetical protein